MAQVTLELGRAGGRPLAGSPPSAVAVAVLAAVLGLGEPRCERGAFFAHAPSAIATTIRTTAHRLADTEGTSVEREPPAQARSRRSVNALSNSTASAVVPYWAASKIGAAASVLQAMISSDSLIPSRCSGAPEMPNER